MANLRPFLAALVLTCASAAHAQDEAPHITPRMPASRHYTRAMLETLPTPSMDDEQTAYLLDRAPAAPCRLGMNKSLDSAARLGLRGGRGDATFSVFTTGGNAGDTTYLALTEHGACRTVVLTISRSYDPTRPLPVLGDGELSDVFEASAIGRSVFAASAAPARLSELVKALADLKFEFGYFRASDLTNPGPDAPRLSEYDWSRSHAGVTSTGGRLRLQKQPAPTFGDAEQVAELGTLRFYHQLKGALWAFDVESNLGWVVWSPRDISSHTLGAFAIEGHALHFTWEHDDRRSQVRVDLPTWRVRVRALPPSP